MNTHTTHTYTRTPVPPKQEKPTAVQDSDGSTTAGEEGEREEEEEGAFGDDFEPTQAYFFPVEEGESESRMECEPTVAYDMEGSVCVCVCVC